MAAGLLDGRESAATVDQVTLSPEPVPEFESLPKRKSRGDSPAHDRYPITLSQDRDADVAAELGEDRLENGHRLDSHDLSLQRIDIDGFDQYTRDVTLFFQRGFGPQNAQVLQVFTCPDDVWAVGQYQRCQS